MKPNQNLDPLAALNNVTEEELSAIQEEKAAKPRKRKPREGFVFLISFYEAIELMPERLQHKAYKVLTRYALYGEMPPKRNSDPNHAIFRGVETTDQCQLQEIR